MTEREIRAKIIASILAKFKDRFRVFDNTGEAKEVVAGQFPDVIFKQRIPPPNNNILFVMKVETGDAFLKSIQEWQALSRGPGVLYIVVPKAKLDEAKILAAQVGARARFASYELDGSEVKEITYE
ncbi:MAG: hypothetical protein IT405_00430 [Candidatus Yanofskybacteria bacterium]|nr:hypothetical protein [Candidatus Yanofskybacteria bacterium]